MNGSLVKVRLDNQGIASGLYETELKPMHKLALSGQFDATNLEKPPKVRLTAFTCGSGQSFVRRGMKMYKGLAQIALCCAHADLFLNIE